MGVDARPGVCVCGVRVDGCVCVFGSVGRVRDDMRGFGLG